MRAASAGRSSDAEPFQIGSTIVRRDVWFGKVWSAWPARVIHDDGESLTTALWPGVEGMAPATWVSWLQTGDRSVREQALERLAARGWKLSPWTWRSTIVVRSVASSRWFAVAAFFRAEDQAFQRWQVDFEVPYHRTPAGIDTRDLFIDLVVGPDYSLAWKDEGEYAEARDLGLVSDEENGFLESAREEALAMIEDRRGPFAERMQHLRVDLAGPIPRLPSAGVS